MDNSAQNGVLNVIATGLAAYGVMTIAENFWYGLIAVLVAAGVFILKEWLRSIGWNVGRFGTKK